jgi:predicted dehydrogenase
VLAKRKQHPAPHYAEWKEMLERERVEAVVVAVPLWAHADVVVPCLEAGKHVLCEKMMAYDLDGCRRMKAAAIKANKVLEIGYQRSYNPVYQAAYDGIIKRELLGDVFHVRLAWHRNGNWRRAGQPPSPDYDPSKWGYPTFEHLWNWRLYWKYSRGLFAELCSHQLNATNWYLGSAPNAVHAYGGVHRYKDGREAHDHIYSIFEYPNGLTATFTSIESNAFDQRYEMFFGTKATLIMYNESDALLFDESGDGRQTSVEVSSAPGGAGVEASETRPANNGPARAVASGGGGPNEEMRASATELEISAFCSAIRTGTPLKCGPDRAFDSARACIAACETAKTPQTRVAIST